MRHWPMNTGVLSDPVLTPVSESVLYASSFLESAPVPLPHGRASHTGTVETSHEHTSTGAGL
ncbi:hypothetical protein EMIT053CA3_130059 [Pseudomonas donghuensis]